MNEIFQRKLNSVVLQQIRNHGKNILFRRIQDQISNNFTSEFLRSLKTKKGKTQSCERNYIRKFDETLHDMGLSFEKAGSQQSKDYRNINGIGLNIEVKKTDSFTIFFNDTLPSDDIYYIILFTGKKYKKKVDIEPKILCMNGSSLVEGSQNWIQQFQQELEHFKNKYCRGENKKRLSGCINTYVRPTYTASIRHLLDID